MEVRETRVQCVRGIRTAPLPGSAFLAEKPSGKQWRCAYATDTLYAGFPHFHFYAKPVMAQRFLAACRKETL